MSQRSSWRQEIHVLHITAVHPAGDVRIFHKESKSLAQAGYRVTLLARQGNVSSSDGVDLVFLPPHRNRIGRMLLTPFRVFRAVRRIRPDVCHLHDPELVPVGLVLKLGGRKVVYDAHEDLGLQVMNKGWIPRLLRKPASLFGRLLERLAARWLDAVVAATPSVAANFPEHKTKVVFNFPRMEEFDGEAGPYATREPRIAYIGGIARARGAFDMVAAMERLSVDGELRMAGIVELSPEELARVEAAPRVEYLGILDRTGVGELLATSRVGLVVLHPLPNYLDSYPVKMFEYMAAGLPVVASDFPLWREIVLGNSCGLVVDPTSPEEIAKAVQYLLENPEEAQEMGKRGREAVERKYSWETQAGKLVDLYDALCASS